MLRVAALLNLGDVNRNTLDIAYNTERPGPVQKATNQNLQSVSYIMLLFIGIAEFVDIVSRGRN